MHTHMLNHACMYTHWLYWDLHMQTCVYTFMHACMYICMYACTHTLACIHMYTVSPLKRRVYKHNYTQSVYINSIWLLTVQTIPQLICHIYTWRQTPYHKRRTPQDGTDPHSNVDYLQHINIPVVLSKWSWKRIIKYRYKHTFKTLKPYHLIFY